MKELLKKIEPYLYSLDEIPLLKGDPFSFEEFSDLLSKKLEQKIEISKTKTSWENVDIKDTYDQICFAFTPLIGNVYFLLEKKDIKKLINSFLKEESESPILQEGLYRYFILQVLNVIQNINPFNKLSFKIIENVKIKAKAALFFDVKIALEKTFFYAKIAITSDFRRSWNEYFSKKDPIAIDAMKKNIYLPLKPILGTVKIEKEDIKNLKKGDFIVLDKTLIDIKTHSSELLFYLHEKPIFRAKIKKNNIKILENFYEEKNMENLLKETNLNLKVELDEISMSLEKVLSLQEGNILELKTSLENPLNLTYNGKKIAEAELVNIGDHIGVRILKLVK